MCQVLSCLNTVKPVESVKVKNGFTYLPWVWLPSQDAKGSWQIKGFTFQIPEPKNGILGGGHTATPQNDAKG